MIAYYYLQLGHRRQHIDKRLAWSILPYTGTDRARLWRRIHKKNYTEVAPVGCGDCLIVSRKPLGKLLKGVELL